MKIYISTANQYIQLIRPFAYLFNKFWSPKREVNILGYDAPTFELPDNFKFISLGKQEGGTKMWSTDLRRFFESIDEKHFIWTLEDHFIGSPVNFKIFNKLTSLLVDDSIGRISLDGACCHVSNHFCVEGEGNGHDEFDIIELHQNTVYRLSTLWSIWNKEYLLKYLQSNWSPWEFEVKGSEKAKDDGYRILATRLKYCINQCQAVRKGNINMLYTNPDTAFAFVSNTGRMDTDSIDEMRKKGII